MQHAAGKAGVGGGPNAAQPRSNTRMSAQHHTGHTPQLGKGGARLGERRYAAEAGPQLVRYAVLNVRCRGQLSGTAAWSGHEERTVNHL
jgi:hypothetical protein